MKKLELNQMEGLEGGKFWGWSDWSWGPCNGGLQAGTRHYYAIFIDVDSDFRTRPC